MAGWASRRCCGWWGWSRQRRAALLRRKLDRPLVLVDRTEPEQPLLSFAEIGPDRELWNTPRWSRHWTSRSSRWASLHRDRGDCENSFDELKNQWVWLHHARPEAVPAARWQRRADLQLVEPVRPSG